MAAMFEWIQVFNKELLAWSRPSVWSMTSVAEKGFKPKLKVAIREKPFIGKLKILLFSENFILILKVQMSLYLLL